jgi:hypothetical protein
VDRDQRVGDPPQLGALGVSDDRERAVERLTEALRHASTGAYGVLHKVTVSLTDVGYWYEAPIIKAEVDQATGDIVVTETGSHGGWGRMHGLLRGGEHGWNSRTG